MTNAGYVTYANNHLRNTNTLGFEDSLLFIGMSIAAIIILYYIGKKFGK